MNRRDFLKSLALAGVAGPVLDGRVKTTNLPWVVRATSLGRVLGTKRVRLMNDLEATAYGGLFLPPKEMCWLSRSPPQGASTTSWLMIDTWFAKPTVSGSLACGSRTS